MSDVKWIKITTDMFDNRKIKHLRRLPEGNNIVLLWVMLLTMAGRCNAGGMIYLTENIPYTTKMLADELDFEENTVRLAIEVLEQFDMIISQNGFFTIAGWEEYQNIDGMEKIMEQNRLRKRRQREAQKAITEPMSRDSHGTVTECHATEEERRGREEKEIHSFIPHTQECEDVENPVENTESLKMKYIGGSLGGGVVMLSDEQFADLCDRLSIDELNKYLAIVRDCELSGQHFKKKTHYQAILDMVKKDRKVK